jgi:adenylate kinase
MIVGIPGVGKSTVITNVFNLHSQEGIDTKIAEFGKIMFEQARLLSINNRDQLRKLSIEQQRSLQEMTANHINSLGNDVVIIDTHLFIRTEHGYYPGMPLKLLNIINPSHLILISAKSEEIHRRRTDDNSRQRDLISIDRISDDLRLSESMISSSSIVSGCPFYIIQNNTDEIEKASSDICKVILSK